MKFLVTITTLASGCQVLFPLGDPPAEAELRCDAVDDAVGLPLVADTYFEGELPHGEESSLRFGTASVLLRFRTDTLAAEDLELTFRMTVADRADECGAACGACAPSTAGTVPRIALTNPEWDEATAMVPPDGDDVSMAPLIGMTSTSDGVISGTFTVPAGTVSPTWPITGEVSILLAPLAASLDQRFGSRENTCGVPQPSLIGRCLRVSP